MNVKSVKGMRDSCRHFTLNFYYLFKFVGCRWTVSSWWLFHFHCIDSIHCVYLSSLMLINQSWWCARCYLHVNLPMNYVELYCVHWASIWGIIAWVELIYIKGAYIHLLLFLLQIFTCLILFIFIFLFLLKLDLIWFSRARVLFIKFIFTWAPLLDDHWW